MHSHKVRVNGDVMMVNKELFRAKAGERPDGWAGGIKLYDIKDKTNPRADRALQIGRVAPLRFGRALRLYLVGGGGLSSATSS